MVVIPIILCYISQITCSVQLLSLPGENKTLRKHDTSYNKNKSHGVLVNSHRVLVLYLYIVPVNLN